MLLWKWRRRASRRSDWLLKTKWREVLWRPSSISTLPHQVLIYVCERTEIILSYLWKLIIDHRSIILTKPFSHSIDLYCIHSANRHGHWAKILQIFVISHIIAPALSFPTFHEHQTLVTPVYCNIQQRGAWHNHLNYRIFWERFAWRYRLMYSLFDLSRESIFCLSVSSFNRAAVCHMQIRRAVSQ